VVRSLAATLTRIARFGVFAPLLRVAWSLAADFRRARTCLLRTVFRSRKAGLNCQERSPISPSTFVPDDERKYIAAQAKSLVFSKSLWRGFPTIDATAYGQRTMAVHNLVDNLIARDTVCGR
jgi:hypothetical protein